MEDNKFFEDYKKLQSQIEKITKNSKGYNYKYADLPHLWENVKEKVRDCNFILYSYNTLEGVTTVLQHESDKVVVSSVPFTEGLEPQKRGSEITYFRRYNLLSLLHLMVEGEDDDAQVTMTKEKQVNKPINKSADPMGL